MNDTYVLNVEEQCSKILMVLSAFNAAREFGVSGEETNSFLFR